MHDNSPMTDDLANQLSLQLTQVFGGARRVTVLAERAGVLTLVGEPTDAQIHAASILMANVHSRVSKYHAYVTPTIPGPALLPRMSRSDRGAIMVAPVLDAGRPVGAVVVEAGRGSTFSENDLARLARLVKLGAPESDAAAPLAEIR